ncbi:MAG: hypothetical protein KHZ79_02690 [Atopobium minutum]|uniref:hypothetical protein n=1 Tax=Atopobium minutum TaxID=1381 RepID=UPI001D90AFC7|nr:hypothetical protein [Atopobium minutum]MBS4873264.1 hypothetical protein [Atopobium minutum]
MRTDITYVNNNGKTVQFGGSDEDLHYLQHDLRANSWAYETGVAKTRISSFKHGLEEKKLPVGIMAKTAKEGIAKSNYIAQIGEYDIMAKRPGRLYVGDWYLPCWIVGVSFSNYWLSDCIAEIELSLVCEKCEWIHETTTQYAPITMQDSDAILGADFEYDFEHDLAGSASSHTLDVPGVFDTQFLWRVYGPATNPYIRIGDNTYKINTSVREGQTLEVDTAQKTIVLIDEQGRRTSILSERARGAKGSGSYIFEPIHPGTQTVTYDNTYLFDITLYEMRSLPPFELGGK